MNKTEIVYSRIFLFDKSDKYCLCDTIKLPENRRCIYIDDHPNNLNKCHKKDIDNCNFIKYEKVIEKYCMYP